MPCMLGKNLLCSLGKSNVTATFCTARGPRWVWPGWTHKQYGGNGNKAFKDVYIGQRWRLKKNMTSRLFYCPLGKNEVFFKRLIDLILISRVSVIGDRLCYFGSVKELFSLNHPTLRTPQSHQIELLMLSWPQSSQHKCQIDYLTHWHSHRLTFL